ncbi:Signal recognition particle protein [Roseimaritima multifibrata]|uniref:signal-recognition-particle GTPase n=1 Tax=Roseimaritima multifibrata TaxID=1930274 RepID=A0A517ML94_9BACT|nr:signal recognition particle protein [Roseimaritima multifibrata]QDS95620.1 Signal recognition particle protein [Roseimaritima multifibrata]
MFDSLSDGLQSAFKSLRGKGKLTEGNMREGLQTVEQAMLEADVNYSVVKDFMEHVTERALGQRVLLSLRPHEELIRIVYDELVSILGPVDTSLHLKKSGCTILMLCGLQGAGKTTTCGKLAQLLLEEKITPTLVAADLQRPAAIEQLHVIGRQLGVPVYSDAGEKDPVKVCQAGVKQAEADGSRVVILDTAGRLAIDKELMAELARIDKRVKPDQVYLVVDGMTGQDAVNSAGAFNKELELDGVVMTKLDGDARGGALLSVKQVTGVPIKFIGTGEHLESLEPFRPEGMASRILQMGDMVAAAREAHRIVDESEREELEEKMASGEMTLDDFKGLMEKVAKPGLMGKMMSLMPGMGQMKDLMQNEDVTGGVKQTIGLINSMTKSERRNPKLIDAPRRARIAAGAGVQAPAVNQLVKQFEQMKPVMQMMAGGNAGDRMQMMRQIQSSGMMSDPGAGGIKVKKGTGKRLSPREKAKLRKQRDKELRQKRRGK